MWTGLSEEELRREATRAARHRDAGALWGLTESDLYLHGSAGANSSRHTLRAYRRAVLDLLDAWQGETLLRRSRNAGPAYLRRLEGRGLAPASVRVKLAGARHLYAALRWSGATTATPFGDARETGGNLEPVARHLGHATLETTRAYAKWSDEHLEESVGRW